MSETEQTEKWICDRLTELKNQGVDLLSKSGREIGELIGILHGKYERFKNSVKSWIGVLYSNLNSNPIQDLNEIKSVAQIPDPPPINVAAIALPMISIFDIGKLVIDVRTNCQAVLEAFTLNEAKKTVARFGAQIVDPHYLRLVI